MASKLSALHAIALHHGYRRTSAYEPYRHTDGHYLDVTDEIGAIAHGKYDTPIPGLWRHSDDPYTGQTRVGHDPDELDKFLGVLHHQDTWARHPKTESIEATFADTLIGLCHAGNTLDEALMTIEHPRCDTCPERPRLTHDGYFAWDCPTCHTKSKHWLPDQPWRTLVPPSNAARRD